MSFHLHDPVKTNAVTATSFPSSWSVSPPVTFHLLDSPPKLLSPDPTLLPSHPLEFLLHNQHAHPPPTTLQFLSRTSSYVLDLTADWPENVAFLADLSEVYPTPRGGKAEWCPPYREFFLITVLLAS